MYADWEKQVDKKYTLGKGKGKEILPSKNIDDIHTNEKQNKAKTCLFYTLLSRADNLVHIVKAARENTILQP